MSKCESDVMEHLKETKWSVEHLVDHQDKDPLWSQVKACVRDSSLPFPEHLRIPRKSFYIEDDILYVPLPNQELFSLQNLYLLPLD